MVNCSLDSDACLPTLFSYWNQFFSPCNRPMKQDYLHRDCLIWNWITLIDAIATSWLESWRCDKSRAHACSKSSDWRGFVTFVFDLFRKSAGEFGWDGVSRKTPILPHWHNKWANYYLPVTHYSEQSDSNGWARVQRCKAFPALKIGFINLRRDSLASDANLFWSTMFVVYIFLSVFVLATW